jgi:hypothetical protein
MKIDPTSPDLPLEWQETPHFDVRVDWLTRTQSETQEKHQAEILEMLKEQAQEIGEDFTDLPIGGIQQRYPGWFVHFNVANIFADSLEEALLEAKKVIKNSDFSASAFGRMALVSDKLEDYSAPAKPFKAQRLELIHQLETPKEEVGKFDFFREAFLEVGEYALHVSLEDIAYREEFETTFGSPANPIRSMIGLECSVSRGNDDDWEDIVTGELELEGNTVRVGSWSREFENHNEVSGAAFDEASVYDEIQDIVYAFYVPDKSIANGDD